MVLLLMVLAVTAVMLVFWISGMLLRWKRIYSRLRKPARRGRGPRSTRTPPPPDPDRRRRR